MPDTDVTPYPRPDLDRSERWQSLDGRWDFFPDERDSLDPAQLRQLPATETIAVPGNWEECASAGRHDWLGTGWYRRSFEVPTDWAGERVWLTIGAVFHAATIWVNGRQVGTSDSGYLPWSADVTDAIDHGTAELLVRVTSPMDKRDILHGKHRSLPVDDYNGCSFTPSSGIWQNVWIEPRPAVHVAAARLSPTTGLDGVDFEIELAGLDADGGTDVTVTITPESAAAEPVAAEQVAADLGSGVARGTIEIEDPRLWSPQDPHLYHFRVEVSSAAGTDSVRVYTGLRTIEARDGRILLNGEPLYVRGVLDQGYWPGTGIAAPDDAALVRDLELARDAGFNLVRKHIKPECPRWLHHADRLGMLVWAEPASPGRLSEASVHALETELTGMLRRDAGHPSIIIWSAYNEEWGLNWALDRSASAREAARSGYRLLKRLDPTRLAVDTSGWNHVESDLLDWHLYESSDPGRFADATASLLAGEPWPLGHSRSYPTRAQLAVESDPELMAAPLINSEYGGGWDSLDRAWHSRWQTQFLRLFDTNHGYVFTELYDIEAETVGVYTTDRRSKDQGGFDQTSVHADTVIIPLLRPLTCGADVVVTPGADFTVEVRVSHTGVNAVGGELTWQLDDRHGSAGRVSVDPFTVSDPIRLTVPQSGAGRLQLEVRSADTVAARTFIDITDQTPTGNVPPDSGWRPAPVPPILPQRRC